MPFLPRAGFARRARTLAGALVASLTVGAFLGPGAEASRAVTARPSGQTADWPQFGYGPTHTAFNPRETTLNAGNVGSMEQKWVVLGVNNGGIAPLPNLAVAGGVAYVGSWDKDISALDAVTGDLLWKGTTGYSVSSYAPSVGHGLVYVVDDNNTLYAFPTSCSDPCSAAWTRGGVGLGGPWFSSPVTVAGSVLYVSGYDGYLYSLNARDGSPRWKAKVNVYETDPLFSPPSADDTRVYVFGDTGVFAFPRECSAACRPLWKSPVRVPSWTAVAVSDGTVFAASFETLYALDAATGKRLWTADVPLTPGAPAVGEGVVVTISRDGQPAVQAFDSAGCGAPTCDPIWTATTDTTLYDPTIANGVVYAGALGFIYVTGQVYAFDLHCSGSCSALWQQEVIGAVERPVAVANGQIFATTLQADVYSFGLPG